MTPTRTERDTRTTVLFIITKSNWGGAQRYVYDLATGLPREQYRAVVALGGTGAHQATPGQLQARLEAVGIPVVVVRHFLRDMRLMSDIRAFFELVRIVHTVRPDALHVTSSKAGGMGAAVGRLLGVRRIVFTSHGLTYDESWRPRWQRFVIAAFTWLSIMLAHTTIMISEATYRRARALPLAARKVVRIHNGITPPAFVAREIAREVLLPAGIVHNPNALIVGTIAEYHPNKNLDVLIEAFAQRTTADTYLVLIGEGEELGKLEQCIARHSLGGRVILTGYVADAAQYLKALDVFVLPSKKEGLPYVLLEAGLASLPVVVSDIDGITDIVTNDVTGLILKAEPAALADALRKLLADEALRARLGGALCTHVEQQFSTATMLENTARYYVPA